MSRRGVAVALAVANAVGLGVTLAWSVVHGGLAAERLAQFLLAVLLVALGALLTVRAPDNRVSWVVAASGAATVLMVLQAPMDSAGPVGAWLAGWTGTWSWVVSMGAIVTVGTLWFPTGRVPSPRWRWVERGLVGAFGLAVVAGTLLPFQVTEVSDAPNPLAITAASDALAGVHEISLAAIALLAIPCSLSLVLRHRRARGLERAQVQWVAWAVAIAVVGYLTGDLTTRLPLVTWPLLTYGGLALVLGAFTVAVLRYRVFEIGRLVSRTVAYALLTAVLAATYGAVVLAMSAVAGPDAGGDAGVAAATLAAAALAGPLRGRVQHLVDRRFHRAVYEAELLVASFNARLRDEVDAGAVAASLREATSSSLAPASVGVWIREEPS